MKRISLPLVALGLAAPLLASSFLGASAASAAPAQPAALTGYQQVVSQVFTQPPGGHGIAFLSCPDETNVIGGGAVLFSAGLEQSIQDSGPAPNGQGFDARVNNNSTTNDNSFQLYAVCATNVQNYIVVTGDAKPHPAGTQRSADATCPVGTVPLTGGGGSTLDDLTITTNSSYPLAHGWRVTVNNASAENLTVSATVACGTRPAGYQRVTGTATIVKAFSQASATAACPTGTKVVSGGGRSSGTSTSVSLNSSAPPSDSAWQVFENNNIPGTSTLTPYAICARAGVA